MKWTTIALCSCLCFVVGIVVWWGVYKLQTQARRRFYQNQLSREWIAAPLIIQYLESPTRQTDVPDDEFRTKFPGVAALRITNPFSKQDRSKTVLIGLLWQDKLYFGCTRWLLKHRCNDDTTIPFVLQNKLVLNVPRIMMRIFLALDLNAEATKKKTAYGISLSNTFVQLLS